MKDWALRRYFSLFSGEGCNKDTLLFQTEFTVPEALCTTYILFNNQFVISLSPRLFLQYKSNVIPDNTVELHTSHYLMFAMLQHHKSYACIRTRFLYIASCWSNLNIPIAQSAKPICLATSQRHLQGTFLKYFKKFLTSMKHF